MSRLITVKYILLKAIVRNKAGYKNVIHTFCKVNEICEEENNDKN